MWKVKVWGELGWQLPTLAFWCLNVTRVLRARGVVGYHARLAPLLEVCERGPVQSRTCPFFFLFKLRLLQPVSLWELGAGAWPVAVGHEDLWPKIPSDLRWYKNGGPNPSFRSHMSTIPASEARHFFPFSFTNFTEPHSNGVNHAVGQPNVVPLHRPLTGDRVPTSEFVGGTTRPHCVLMTSFHQPVFVTTRSGFLLR